MKRRTFIKSSAVAATVATGFATTAIGRNTVAKGKQEFYDLTVYRLKSEAQKDAIQKYLKNAVIPFLNKKGIKAVGVFEEITPGETPALYVLTPYQSPDQYLEIKNQSDQDVDFQKNAATYLQVSLKEPAYARIDKSFLLAFEDIPQIEVPQNKERIFELRKYESHSELAGKKKVKMFNAGGEIAIFRRTGLTPVFFGEAIFGKDLPHLTYMITFKNMEEKDKSWKAFSSDPAWIKLKEDPEYLDTVSNIVSIMLKPLEFSQI